VNRVWVLYCLRWNGRQFTGVFGSEDAAKITAEGFYPQDGDVSWLRTESGKWYGTYAGVLNPSYAVEPEDVRY
jgi:hypothetical protein